MTPTTHPPAVDSEPGHRPGVPMEATPEPRPGSHWERPEPQTPTVRVFHSTAKRDLPAVFGTGQPPKGLSGLLRRIAYRIPEHRARHWMMLLLADRIDVLEHRLRRPSNGTTAALGLFAALAMLRARRSH